MTRLSPVRLVLSAAALNCVALPAWAHTGHLPDWFSAEGLLHTLSEIDHVLPLLAVGAVVVAVRLIGRKKLSRADRG